MSSRRLETIFISDIIESILLSIISDPRNSSANYQSFIFSSNIFQFSLFLSGSSIAGFKAKKSTKVFSTHHRWYYIILYYTKTSMNRIIINYITLSHNNFVQISHTVSANNDRCIRTDEIFRKLRFGNIEDEIHNAFTFMDASRNRSVRYIYQMISVNKVCCF